MVVPLQFKDHHDFNLDRQTERVRNRDRDRQVGNRSGGSLQKVEHNGCRFCQGERGECN